MLTYTSYLLLYRLIPVNSQVSNQYKFLFFSLVCILLVGCLQSEFITNSAFHLLKFCSVFIYSKLLIDECIKDPSFINRVINCLKISCILSIVFLFIQLFVGLKFTIYPSLHPNIFDGEINRFPSFSMILKFMRSFLRC